MNLKRDIVSQFKQPHGVLGQLAGFFMANRSSNIERNEWTLDLLSIEPSDYILEVGFGPGIAIEKASEIITDGLLVGIDHSATMLHQARKRNADMINRGVVELYLGSLDSLPIFERPFDKIFSANVVQFWQNPVTFFGKLRSLMAVGGIIATTYMPRNSDATNADAHRKAEEVEMQLKAAGFSSIRVEEKRMNPVSAVSVLAVNNESLH
jgi:trans-aconitate methyltransferase